MPNKFEYHRPTSSKEACQIKTQYGHESKCLAGGTDLLLQWRNGDINFRHCIDLTFTPELRYLKTLDNELRIGALTTLADLENIHAENCVEAILALTSSQMCTPQTRTIATVGGNLCNASPAADLSVLFIALGAKAILLGPSGEREVSAENLFRGVNKNTLMDDEFLTELRIPLTENKTAPTFRRAGRTVVDIAQVNCAVSLTMNADGVLVDPRIALGAVAPVPIRSPASEKMLSGSKIADVNDELIESVSIQAASDTKPISDIRGSEAYRRYISKILVKQSIQESIQKLNGDPS